MKIGRRRRRCVVMSSLDHLVIGVIESEQQKINILSFPFAKLIEPVPLNFYLCNLRQIYR